MPEGDHAPIYDDLIRFKPGTLTLNAWATKAGVSRTVWSDIRRHGNPSRRTLQRLLAAAGSSLAEFEALRITGGSLGETGDGAAFSDRSGSWRAAELPPLPLLATAIAAEWGDPESSIEMAELRPGEIVERVARPASLAGDASAYAITIVGDSMWPRFRPGRRVAVSAKAPLSIGDDVLVKLKSAGAAGLRDASVPVLIKELVRRASGGVELRQFNPDVMFHVPVEDIEGIEKVLGELV